MRLRPDIVAVTGDIVEGDSRISTDSCPCSECSPRRRSGPGTASATTTTSPMRPSAFPSSYASVGITTLRNESRVLRGDARGASSSAASTTAPSGRPTGSALPSCPRAAAPAARAPPRRLLRGRAPRRRPRALRAHARRTDSLSRRAADHSAEPLPSRRGPLRARHAVLMVTRGLGAVGLPWRCGADPEAVLLRIRAMPSG